MRGGSKGTRPSLLARERRSHPAQDPGFGSKSLESFAPRIRAAPCPREQPACGSDRGCTSGTLGQGVCAGRCTRAGSHTGGSAGCGDVRLRSWPHSNPAYFSSSTISTGNSERPREGGDSRRVGTQARGRSYSFAPLLAMIPRPRPPNYDQTASCGLGLLNDKHRRAVRVVVRQDPDSPAGRST